MSITLDALLKGSDSTAKDSPSKEAFHFPKESFSGAEVKVIQGKEYLTLKSFAKLVGRTEQAVRFLVNRGNSIRKLRAAKLNTSLYILASEVNRFPFTEPGRGKNFHTFSSDGKEIHLDTWRGTAEQVSRFG